MEVVGAVLQSSTESQWKKEQVIKRHHKLQCEDELRSGRCCSSLTHCPAHRIVSVTDHQRMIYRDWTGPLADSQVAGLTCIHSPRHAGLHCDEQARRLARKVPTQDVLRLDKSGILTAVIHKLYWDAEMVV